MSSPSKEARDNPWNAEQLAPILKETSAIHADMLRLEQDYEGRLAEVHEAFQKSARNLLHYLALRRHDVRGLQEKLASLGLSSLGRTESHALAALEAVLKVLHHISAREWESPRPEMVLDFAEGKALLQAHTSELLGPRPPHRGVRIMVTMPAEAATSYELVRDLVAQGMNVMRVNCAHDDREAWAGMIENLRRAREKLGRGCQVLMDIAGPKLRTGAIDARSQVLKWRPQRDLYGRVTAPAHVWLTPADQPVPAPAPASGSLLVQSELLARARSGDQLKFSDLRGKSRTLEVKGRVGPSRWAASTETVYLDVGRALQLTHVPKAAPGQKLASAAEVGAPPASAQFILLAPGDTLILTRAQTPGRPAVRAAAGRVRHPAAIPCTTPEIFADVRPDERIWFDDGKIGGVIADATSDEIRVRITSAKPAGDKLRADKGINLPDSNLRLPPLTAKDIDDLAFVVQHADIVGLSFVRRPEDVHLLQTHLERLGAQDLAVMLKIETRSAFERLPSLLLAAMRGRRAGVMIARGDLAVEVGWERLAEAQEEILWICEAAHIPVIWATQVLENLAKKGVPSRAEITDAAMGERAECVMLNKGPHLVEAVRVLDDILQRMEAHQTKKTARLRSLRLSAID